jgi:hypothetical protein
MCGLAAASDGDTSERLVDSLPREWMSAFVTVMAAGRTSSLPSCCATHFSGLQSGLHPLRGPEDLKRHTLIHDRSIESESAFPTWRTWLQAASFPEICTEAKASVADVA